MKTPLPVEQTEKTQVVPPLTPELDKQNAIINDANVIGEFLEWLREHCGFDYENCAFDDRLPAGLVLLPGDTTKLLAEYFEIDLDRTETERREVLRYARCLRTFDDQGKELCLDVRPHSGAD